MRQFTLLILLVFTELFAYAQLADPLIGPEYNTSRKENFSGFLGETTLALYTADYIYHTRRKQELIIRKFHKGDLQLIEEVDLYTELKDGYTNEPEEIFFQGKTFFLFSKLISTRDNSKLLALETFDLNLKRIDFKVVDTLDEESMHYIEESSSNEGFILASHLKYTQLTEQEIELVQIDGDGGIRWQKTVKSPMALQNLRIEHIQFGKDTPVYLLCNYAFDLSQGNFGDQLVNNNYSIWSYDRKSEFLKEFDLRLKKKWVNGIRMKINDQQELIVAGYFNETKNQTINGVFSLIINNELKLQGTSSYTFQSAVLNKFFQNRDPKKNTELKDYQLKSIQLLNDGSFFLLGEQYYKYIERTYDPRTNITTTTEHYNYNSICCSYFDANGNHKWTERLPKVQSSTNDYGYFSSFTTLNDGKDLYLMFNDSRKNNDSPPKSYFGYADLFNNRKFQISYIHLTPNGVKTRAGLISEDFDHMLRAKLSSQVNENSIYLITETSRDSRIIRVQTKDAVE